MAASLIKEALKGNIAAVKEIADRIDGKVPLQQVITGDEEGGAVRFYAEVPKLAATTEEWLENIRRETLRERWSPVFLLVSTTSRRIRRRQTPPPAEAKSLMMSHYFMAPGSLPQRLPQ